MQKSHVPAEGWYGVKRSTFLFTKTPVTLHHPPQRGHVPNRHVLFDKWISVRGFLLEIVHAGSTRCRQGEKWKRVEMVLEGLRLQATTGQCFAGARYLGASGLGSEKTWDRTLSHLRSLRLVETTRLVREDGRQSTNLADFSALWTLLLTLLAQRSNTLELLVSGLWVKLHGMWIHVRDLVAEVLAPPDTSAPAPQPPL